MLNNITIQGRLVRDPELRRTQSGTPVTTFTVAVERDNKETDGSRKTDFIDAVVWRQGAEFICNYGRKGRMVIVDGKLQIREWKDREGNSRRSAEVLAGNVYLCDSRKDGGVEQQTGFREMDGESAEGDLPF